MAHELSGLLGLRTAADILIVDLRMPKKDGLEGITELMSRPTHPRTIVLTSSEKATDLRRSLATGTKGYLVKGAAVHDGWNAVREVAAGRSSPRNVAAKPSGFHGSTRTFATGTRSAPTNGRR
jgi:DNA-binding NarL/FixJ family response regulator